MNVTTTDKLTCLERELKYRIRVYARLVDRGKMSEPQRQHEIRVMEAIRDDYRERLAQEAPPLLSIGQAMNRKAIDELANYLDRLTEARREIAIAKLVAFIRQADDMAAELPLQWHTQAMKAMREMALANDLDRIHGREKIERILAEGFTNNARRQ